MEEDCASAALNSWPLVVAGLNHNIIEAVGTFEVFMGGGIGQIYPAVVVSVAYSFTPAPAFPDR
jgi:hypothetical protein